jgi:hypothetical protein
MLYFGAIRCQLADGQLPWPQAALLHTFGRYASRYLAHRLYRLEPVHIALFF